MELLSALGVDLPVIIAQMINYGVLLIALSVLLYRPILRLLDERRDRIQKSMEDAKKIEAQLKEMEQHRQKSMKELDAKAATLLADAKKQADVARTEMLTAAQKEADALLERNKKQLEDEKRRMVADLEKTVAHVSVKLASRILEREFSATDQQRILSSFEKDLPALLR